MQIPNRLFSTTHLRCLAAATVLVLMMCPLHANIILPGDTTTPDVFPNPGSVSTLDHIHGTFNFGSGALTGSYDEFVLDDPFGLTCSSCLDFAFLLSVDQSSTNSIRTFGFANIFGYTTDAGYALGTGGGVDPDFMSRFANNGAVDALGWGFTGLLGPGQSTDALVVVTNATSYNTTGFVSMNIDADSSSKGRPGGFISNLDGPVAVPEPSTGLLLSLGIAGIAACLRKAS